jgi:aspartate aminotransferase
MSIVADHIRNIRPSETGAMTARARELRARGREVITLSQGEPDFDTPENIREAAVKAIRDGHTRYTAITGIGPLREAIRDKLLKENDLGYTLEQIIVGCGAKQVLFNAFFASLNPGDEVIIPAPCWVSYPDMVRLAHGTPVVVACPEHEGFKLTPQALMQAITPRTRWLLLNSPSNPTGAVYSEAELAALAEVLRQYPRIWVLSDDIYEKLIHDNTRFVTMAKAAPDLFNRTLTVNGVSKTNAMTGWRIGYGAGPLELIKAMGVIQGQTTSNASSISQHAALAALTGDQSYIARFAAEFRKRRDLLVAKLNQVPGLGCTAPQGAFYVFPSCAGIIGRTTRSGQRIETDTDFAMYLLNEAGVAVVPGSGFLASPYIRVSFAASEDALRQASDRIIAACQNLVRGAAA